MMGNKNNEEWIFIDGFSNYQISTLGRIKSMFFGKEKILNPLVGKTDMHYVVFTKIQSRQK